ncbi:MAG TPA: hypothetical protein VH062_13430 [Polyangiaceae bacterium]|jgi:hypothetical protein|nr:hypothetical protein [Polyangiaceae bacterium]
MAVVSAGYPYICWNSGVISKARKRSMIGCGDPYQMLSVPQTTSSSPTYFRSLSMTCAAGVRIEPKDANDAHECTTWYNPHAAREKLASLYSVIPRALIGLLEDELSREAFALRLPVIHLVGSSPELGYQVAIGQ